MIKADARQKEQQMQNNAFKMRQLAFDDMSYEQSMKLRQEQKEMYKKQQFYKYLIQHSDYLKKEEIDNEERMFRENEITKTR